MDRPHPEGKNQCKISGHPGRKNPAKNRSDKMLAADFLHLADLKPAPPQQADQNPFFRKLLRARRLTNPSTRVE